MRHWQWVLPGTFAILLLSKAYDGFDHRFVVFDWVLCVLGSLVILNWLSGLLLRRPSVVFETIEVAQPPEAVWRVLTDYAHGPSWRPDMQSAVRLPDRGGQEVWKYTARGAIYEYLCTTVEAVPLQRHVCDITFVPYWLHGSEQRVVTTIQPAERGSRIVHTVYYTGPIFRSLGSRFATCLIRSGTRAALRRYLEALAREAASKPNEAPQPTEAA